MTGRDDGVTDTLPEGALPVLKLVPLQEVALVELQVRVTLCPRVMTAGLGFEDSVAVGVGGTALTTTMADVGALEPAPFVQVRVYVYVFTLVSTPIACDPLDDFDPDQSPEAVQEVGLPVVLQVMVGFTTLTVPEVGEAKMLMAGTTPGLTVTLVQLEQLLLSSLSATEPDDALFCLSAQTRMEYVPADGNVTDGE